MKRVSQNLHINRNYLPGEYENNNKMTLNHNYLPEQFADYKVIFEKIEQLVLRSDYTLGRYVDEFEDKICSLTGARHAVGVGSGTDALFLSLKSLDISSGDEVITTPFTFFATIGAIVAAGAHPVFIDTNNDFNIDTSQIEDAINSKTKAILPVHWSGLICDVDTIREISERHGIPIIEDACHAIQAYYRNCHAGRFGLAGCFSMHPLKNLNVWGDGGFIITDSKAIYERLTLLRNHGLISRDIVKEFAYNSRLDSIQAIVANHLLDKLDFITQKRIENANYYDLKLKNIEHIYIPERKKEIKHVYHIYSVLAKDRDRLQKFLISKSIDAKVHYPIPMHLQPAAKIFGYKQGDFPVAEKLAQSTISLPVHEYITSEQIDYVVSQIEDFYSQ